MYITISAMVGTLNSSAYPMTSVEYYFMVGKPFRLKTFCVPFVLLHNLSKVRTEAITWLPAFGNTCFSHFRSINAQFIVHFEHSRYWYYFILFLLIFYNNKPNTLGTLLSPNVSGVITWVKKFLQTVEAINVIMRWPIFGMKRIVGFKISYFWALNSGS